MVENEKQENEIDLIEELTPTLHQEGACDFSTTVKTIFLGGDFARTDGILHTRGRRHGILAADANAIEKKGPYITDDPSVLRNTPGSREHEEADEHNGSILNKTPSTTEPLPLSIVILEL